MTEPNKDAFWIPIGLPNQAQTAAELHNQHASAATMRSVGLHATL
jgi:hypothetical protein